MPRQMLPGTPSRSPRYVIPASGNRLTVRSLAAAGALLGVGVVLFLLGFERVASPGPVAAAHSTIDATCVQCHQPAQAAVDMRCERCHDPLDAQRFTVPAHASLGGGAWHGEKAEAIACASCHTEHQGRSATLQDVSDRRCASCHVFSGFAGHPEIAAVRAAREPDAPLDFSHEIHLRELARVGGDRCQACHRSTPDQGAFEPITFDTNCASCHILDGVLTLNGRDTLPSSWALLSLVAAGGPAPRERDARGRAIFPAVAHRDAWTIASAEAIARTLPATGLAFERERLIDRTARLTAMSAAVPVGTLTAAQLDEWAVTLGAEITAIDRRIQDGPAAPADAAALLGPLATAIDPSLGSMAAGIAGVSAETAPAPAGGSDAEQVAARRQELEQLLAAVDARASGDQATRAAALRTRITALQVEAAAAGDRTALADGLRDRLAALDAAIDAVEIAGGPALAADTELLRRAALERLAGGDAVARAAWRRDVLALVDAIGARAAAPLQPRVAELRSAILTLSDTPAELEARRVQKVRLLERINLERALLADEGTRGPSDAVAASERTAATGQMRRLNTRIATLDRHLSSSASGDAARNQSSLQGLLDACLKCHRMNDELSAMRPTSPPPQPLPAATFSHRPHLLQARCETCHVSVETSKTALDVNLPVVATCQSCHNRSQAPTTCTTCHVFHPRSAAELVAAPWH